MTDGRRAGVRAGTGGVPAGHRGGPDARASASARLDAGFGYGTAVRGSISANLFAFCREASYVAVHGAVRRRRATDEDWRLLLDFIPREWDRLAVSTGAVKGLRKDKDPESLLRVLLMHLGCGHSLRETAVRAREAGLGDLSDVALMKRLRKSKAWLRALCLPLFRELGVEVSSEGGFQVRAFDATTVKEPGRTGTLWRIHYSVTLPSLVCDHFRITRAKGEVTGESFCRFPVADQWHSDSPGISGAVFSAAASC